jgi:hypothetical protein
MGGAHMEEINMYKCWSEKLKGRDHMDDLAINGRRT